MSCTIKRSENCGCVTQAHQLKVEIFDRVLDIAEKISVVALGVLAATTSSELFVPFFLAGSAYGIYSYFQNRDTVTVQGTLGCTQGFLEQLTGIKLPRPVSFAANVAIVVCHLDHHASVFVPLVGISVGAWAGKMGAECLSFAARTITSYCRAHPSLPFASFMARTV